MVLNRYVSLKQDDKLDDLEISRVIEIPQLILIVI